jgi:hypothetical protein
VEGIAPSVEVTGARQGNPWPCQHKDIVAAGNHGQITHGQAIDLQITEALASKGESGSVVLPCRPKPSHRSYGAGTGLPHREALAILIQ